MYLTFLRIFLHFVLYVLITEISSHNNSHVLTYRIGMYRKSAQFQRKFMHKIIFNQIGCTQTFPFTAANNKILQINYRAQPKHRYIIQCARILSIVFLFQLICCVFYEWKWNRARWLVIWLNIFLIHFSFNIHTKSAENEMGWGVTKSV